MKYLKHILGLKSSTPNCIVYGECGVKPISIDTDCRMINFWSNLVVPNELNYLAHLIKLHLKLTSSNVNRQTFQWFKHIKIYLSNVETPLYEPIRCFLIISG